MNVSETHISEPFPLGGYNGYGGRYENFQAPNMSLYSVSQSSQSGTRHGHVIKGAFRERLADGRDLITISATSVRADDLKQVLEQECPGQYSVQVRNLSQLDSA